MDDKILVIDISDIEAAAPEEVPGSPFVIPENPEEELSPSEVQYFAETEAPELYDFGGICAVCGCELTPFGSKSIKDGSICRNCAKKLSEWISSEVLENMSTEEIIAHIEYRCRNRKALEGFIPVKNAGGKYKLYVDEANCSFLISRKKDFVSANADLLKIAAVEKVRSYLSADAEQNCADLMMDIDMEEGEIRHLSFRVNEFPGLEIGSGEFEKAINDSFEIAELFRNSGVNTERIVFEYGE